MYSRTSTSVCTVGPLLVCTVYVVPTVDAMSADYHLPVLDLHISVKSSQFYVGKSFSGMSSCSRGS